MKSYDAHLPSFHKASEERNLMERVLTKSKTDRYWVGLSWNYYGGYHWSDFTTLNYVNWGYGEPNNHNGEENCAVWCLLPDLDESYWNDYFCYATKSYICQIPRGKDPAGKKI